MSASAAKPSGGGGSAAARPRREDFAHVVTVPTRWNDMDVLGHVNNAKFFTFDEQARLAYFEAVRPVVPDFWEPNGQGLILARIGCDFVAQLRHPALLTVGMRVARLGRSSLDTLAGMFDGGGQLIAVSTATVVWFDYAVHKPKAIPEEVRALIREREVVAPVEG